MSRQNVKLIGVLVVISGFGREVKLTMLVCMCEFY